MPFITYDPDPAVPGTGWATDDKGRRINVELADVPSVEKLPRAVAPAAPAPMAAAPAAMERPGMTPRVKSLLGATDAATRGLVKSGAQVQSGASPEALGAFSSATRAAADTLATQAEAQGQDRTERAQQSVQARAAAIVPGALQASADQQAAAEMKAANDKALADLRAEADPEPDAGRWVNSLSTGAKIGLVVAAAVQGAFRGLAGQSNDGPDSVTSIISRRMDQDLMLQKEQIASGRVRRGNVIAGLMEKGYDLKTAEAAARAKMENSAARMAELQAEMTGTPEAAEAAKALAGQLRANAEQNIANAQLANAPRVTATFAPPAPAAKADALGEFTKQLAARKSYEEAGASAEELAAFDKALGMPTPSGKSTTQLAREKPTEAQAKKAEAVSTLQGLYDSLEGLPDTVFTRESSSLPRRMAHGGADFLFGEGSGEKMDLTLSKEDLADSQKFLLARNSFLSQLSVLNQQGAMAGAEYENAKEAASAANSPAKLRAAIKDALQARGGAPRGAIQTEDR